MQGSNPEGSTGQNSHVPHDVRELGNRLLGAALELTTTQLGTDDPTQRAAIVHTLQENLSQVGITVHDATADSSDERRGAVSGRTREQVIAGIIPHIGARPVLYKRRLS
jgi:hypothetical protein